ncbi:hypothetical protein GLOIN_2v1734993 [Rhizophagus irregularis DAOM 181602=DAOM 197198]|uniref:Uncharacterized protein n=1 Tax=Rhizophagus irregularis (strain DAOM 181602 / DAOM 197198 / MUCL 43194) TaxID=747089 RepID=A0A2P4NXU4_RHIID|nr:hypothetical protein GLOIN_2v1734993 [Rhizophagus irregularis DAOM 181602=DAOM 197198]POG57960.1 hypothetical protein GLOIN_2v1734993 [Rhizophagus irregularis DAOM 181602=DAOM 197198]|eukprot:XP_025164826.1 hypothetical protein GLOIN_2v1734993 [Rhizophagus irregularis DAOM 181602=DAOM 197198]
MKKSKGFIYKFIYKFIYMFIYMFIYKGVIYLLHIFRSRTILFNERNFSELSFVAHLLIYHITLLL